MKLLGLLLLLACSPALAAASALPVKVFLCAGQSNMSGTFMGPEGPPGYAGVFPAQNIWFRWSDIETKNDKWDPMAAGAGGFGPDKTFTLEMAKAYPDSQVAILKVHRGATPIEFWLAGPTNPYNTRLGAAELAKQVAAVTADLNAQKASGKIPDWTWAGLIWMQGEGDANGVNQPPGTYLALLKSLAAWARSATATPNLPIVIGRISSQLSPTVVRASGTLRVSKSKGAPNDLNILPDECDNLDDGQKRGPLWHDKQLQNVRADEVAFCQQDPKAAWIDIDDLTPTDPYHYNAAGYEEMGRRFAKAYLNLVKSSP
jgi:hypothetical protein